MINGLSENKFTIARRASGFSLEEVTKIAGLKSISTYVTHEKDPSLFRLSEISKIYKAMNPEAQYILKSAVDDIFLD